MVYARRVGLLRRLRRAGYATYAREENWRFGVRTCIL